MTRDTVINETPAKPATSLMLAEPAFAREPAVARPVTPMMMFSPSAGVKDGGEDHHRWPSPWSS